MNKIDADFVRQKWQYKPEFTTADTSSLSNLYCTTTTGSDVYIAAEINRRINEIYKERETKMTSVKFDDLAKDLKELGVELETIRHYAGNKGCEIEGYFYPEKYTIARDSKVKETETMPTKKYDKLGNGLYAKNSHELWLYKITEFPICGQYLYLNIDEWDGDITAILRLITKTYGWLEKPKYFKIKDKITKAYKMKQEQKEKDEELKKAKVFKLQTSIRITKVEFNGPATIVFWSDNTKTVVKCGKYETIDHEKGLAMAISKKVLGNQGNYFNEFKHWIGEV